MNRLKAYLSVVKAEILVSLSYIAYSYASIIASFTQIIIFYFIWKAVYIGKNTLNGYNYNEILIYVVLSRIILNMFGWGVNQYMSELIKGGLIGVRLLYPTNFILNLYCAGIGNNLIVNAVFSGIPTIIFSILVLNIKLPYFSINYLIFIISLFLGFTIMFLFDFLLGILNFWTENGWGIQTIKSSLFKFFSGALIPISFFPDYLKFIAYIMPFKSVVDSPINILLGKYDLLLSLKYILFQIGWILILGIINKIFFDYAVKRVTIYGG